jgi:hypothetical protein
MELFKTESEIARVLCRNCLKKRFDMSGSAASSSSVNMAVRKATHADSWYSGDTRELSRYLPFTVPVEGHKYFRFFLFCL